MAVRQQPIKITLTSDDLLPIEEAAQLLNVHRATVYRWILRCKIASVVIGNSTFIPKTEIDRLKGDFHA